MERTRGTDADFGTQPQGRWTIVWGAITFAMLAVAFGFSLADGSLQAPVKAAAAGLCGLWGAWYWVFVVRMARWQDRLPVLFVSFVLSVLVAAALSFIHPAFVLLLFGYYGIAFGALPLPWAIPIVVLSSLSLAARFMHLGPGWPAQRDLLVLVGFLFAGFLDTVLGLFVGSIVRQTRERQRMIEDLEAAREGLARAEREAGALAERQRLAGEIHDTLAQGFTSIVLHLEAADLAYEADPPAARAHAARALAAARENLAEARRVLWALKPEILEREPLGAALARIARKWGEESGVLCEATVTGAECALPPEVEVALLRAAQEALANVRKHAGASSASVTLSYMDDQVVLDVQDDGRGFAVGRVPGGRGGASAGGFGLEGMRARVEGLGGTLSVESAPGEGTTVMASIPVSPRRTGAEAGT